MIRKHLLCILCILCCALSLSACGQTNVTRSIGESKTFSKEDITSAMDQAEQYFSDHFPDCTLNPSPTTIPTRNSTLSRTRPVVPNTSFFVRISTVEKRGKMEITV